MTNSSRPMVLAVDGDTMALELMDMALSARFELLPATSGEQALSLLKEHDVAVVLSDHMLPGLTGVELLDQAHQLRPTAARMLITASDRAGVFSDAVNRARIHRLLVKPVRWQELMGWVEDALREAHLESENARLIRDLAEANHRLEAEVEQRTRELKEAIARLEELAVRDELTGLYNHRYLQTVLDTELARATRHGHPFAVLFIDVDSFKHYNDRHGHPTGDEVLKRIAHTLRGGGGSGLPVQTRASDVVARYGGEEFMMILPETNLEGAIVKAERVRQRVSEQEVPHAREQPLGCLSVSIGVAVFPEHGQDKATLIAAADAELYRAKRSGRNRVCAPGR